MKRKTTDLQTLTRLALLVAIELVMKAIGLGSVPVGPLYMSFLTLPIAVGAITMGPLAGLIYEGLRRLDKKGNWSCILSAMCAPLLNTVFFMGYIVLAFYDCDYVQGLVASNGASNPLIFVVLLVGVQGVAEFLVSGLLGGLVARAVERYLSR